MITFDEFKRKIREKEEREGTNLELSSGVVSPRAPLTDNEIHQMYDKLQGEPKTGQDHAGDIIGGGHVLELKDVGR